MKQLDHQETQRHHQARQITLICDGIILSANIGGIFRLADAFGLENIIFGGTEAEPTSRKVKHVSRSTHQWVKYEKSEILAENIHQLRNKGYKIIALEITNNSRPLNLMKISQEMPVALVIGSEISGVSKDILDLCDEAFHIPMFGKNTSMNVTNALGIVLYELSKIKI